VTLEPQPASCKHRSLSAEAESRPVATPMFDMGSLQWQCRPSVGTWNHPEFLMPNSASKARTPRSWATSEKSVEVQLWPATPDSTPPATPRMGGSDVTWVPVPNHLLNEVQQVLMRAGYHWQG
jgi:hypothetical protein